MRRLLTTALCAVLLMASARPAPAFTGIAPCTVVAVEMLDAVDSTDARPGDFFRFQTVNAVTSGNRIVIPARTMGEGIVVVASAAGRNGRVGTLVLEPRYLILPTGEHLGVVLNHNTSGLEKSGASNGVPGYLGAIPIPGVGAAIGIFNYFHNGKNIVVERGQIFTVFPSDDPDVERCQTHPSY
jgi:hypothetical protein